ncbi:MAG: hypothetical protein ACJA0J_001323 [Bdellovibrionota bacterium]|jgi:hypothetical protein
MKIAINQSYFFPYLGYFQLIASADFFIAYENSTYAKQSWISRNRLQGKSSAPYYISLPIAKRPPEGLLLSNVMLADTATYKMNKLMKRIKADYKSAPFFTETFGWLAESVAEAPYNSLHEFNAYYIGSICSQLGIKTRLSLQNGNLSWVGKELEENPTESKEWCTRERLRLILNHFDADTYINLPGGRALYNYAGFSSMGIELKFLAVPEHTYPQFNTSFTPHLSILDTMMHCGITQTSAMINDFAAQNPD